MSSIILNPFQLLEVNIISAQDLRSVSRSMRSYAVVWVHPDRKLSTRVDTRGRRNPTWNDKFVFRVDEEFLRCDTSAVMIEIYAVHWFRDVLVGTIRLLVSNLLPPPSRPFRHQRHIGMRFVALQVRRPSGRPQGILNVGVALLDSSMRSMPLYTQLSASAVGFQDLLQRQEYVSEHNTQIQNPPPQHQKQKQQQQMQMSTFVEKPELRRTKSDTSSMQGPRQARTLNRKVSFREKPNSIINASMVNGSALGHSIFKGKSSKASSVANGSAVGVKGTKPERKDAKSSVSGGSQKAGGKSIAKKHGLEFGDPRKPGELYITESELGPSPSELAAVAAKERMYKVVDDTENSGVGGWSLNESVEGLQSKLERWRMELPTIYDRSDFASYGPSTKGSGGGGGGGGGGSRHARRHTEGESGKGLFSCFSNICGCQCSIVCGGDASSSKKRTGRRRRRSASPASSTVV
ncbi:hypothetical protein EUGRSUZ_H00123 [Eucalyptus grandis]|uniref:Uncharacterized protein n=2 Tax=Eucalyptus grandis TaxID=71139 RepID=A0ACC3JLM2_EUCGR|nr:hypothetical protein EUGRSUZ_H00123 [Eucalyptus grandis]